jgi:two-component system sensor histidine kinase GlrK
VLRLLLLGFMVVALPLGIGLVAAFVSVELLSRQSEAAILDAARGVLSGQKLGASIVQMEGNARRYRILGDRTFFDLAIEERLDFSQAIEALRKLELTPALKSRLQQLVDLEADVFENLTLEQHDSEPVAEAVGRFEAMSEQAGGIQEEMIQIITRDTQILRGNASRLKHTLAWLATALILAAFGLATWLAMVLARPINRVESAIRQLGEGNLDQHIEVRGPRDLEEVGHRLDWLRLKLQDAEQQQTRFLRHVSHELKTPLTAIREGTELLRDQVPGPLNSGQLEVAGILRENSVRLQRQIEDLLSYSQAGLPDVVRVRERVRLASIVQTVVADQTLAIQSRGIDVQTDLQPVAVFGDPEKLRVVVDNLLSNAVKHSPRAGVIRIDLWADGSQAVLDVLDQGPGIDPTEHQRIFEAFVQGKAPYSGHVSGTGLGLAITKEYLLAHGGSIGVVDADLGAHLRVRLPIGNEE